MAVETPFRRKSAATASLDPARATDSSAVLSDVVLRAILSDTSADAVAVALINQLVGQFPVRRVSLGIRQSGSTVLMAVSDQMKLDTRRSLPRLLAAALTETLDADVPIELGDTQESDTQEAESVSGQKVMYPAHAELRAASKGNRLLSFSLEAKHHRYALLLEYPNDVMPAADLSVGMSELVKPSIAVLDVLVRQERSFLQTIHHRSRRFIHALSRGALSIRQSLAFASLVLLALSFVFPVTAKVTSRASIVAADSQLIVAPQNGFVQSAEMRAGDTVKSGDLLATLDNRDLRLTADKWQSEAQQNKQAQAQALASRDRIELGRLRADRARIDAELALVDRQLLRAELRSPFDGIITEGDLSQSLGASVEQGEKLFTVAKTADYRLELDVDEHDVALVNKGQTLGVRLSSAPGTALEATIEELLPVAQSKAGVSTFRVQAELLSPPAFLRPGMEGIAKIDVGRRTAADVYTRKLRNGLRLWAWKLGLL